jgi:group I intron endonuclease
MNTGIYVFKCILNGKHYVGSAQNIAGRIASHVSALKGNRHENKLLQEDYNKYGEQNFETLILSSNLPNNVDMLTTAENMYMANFDSINNGYNKIKSNRISIVTEERKRKHSESMKGKNSNIDLELLLKIKEEILRLDDKTIQREIERIVSEKFSISSRTVGRIIRGEYRLSEEIGGSLKDWKGGVDNS